MINHFCGLGRVARILAIALMPVLLAGLNACSDSNKGKTRADGKPHLVEVSAARFERLGQTAERTGSLRALQSAKLFNQEEGRVTEVRVREGDVVQRNDILATLDDRLLSAEYNKADAGLRQARQDLHRLEQLKEKQLVSEEALSRARTAFDVASAEYKVLKTRLDYTRVRAPFDGTIAQRLVEPGDVAPKHTHMLTLVDPSLLITDVPVSELELPSVSVGGNAFVSIDALGKQSFKGKVLRIHPTIDPATRLGRIEVALDPVPQGARAGQFCRVSLETSAEQRLLVPFAALRRDQDGEFIYVVGKDSKIQKRMVISGVRMTDKVEVRSGLQPGDQAVTRGFLGLDEGKTVKVVGQASTADTEKAPQQQNENKTPEGKSSKPEQGKLDKHA
ncbi:MAG: efflux RND transporter periplasmic adaptor subunit [Gammaproteobacteria bacterium]|nr:efflux RND transporter periplasmic adaptor subunit [Gammaproteobacteria bacterium]